MEVIVYITFALSIIAIVIAVIGLIKKSDTNKSIEDIKIKQSVIESTLDNYDLKPKK